MSATQTEKLITKTHDGRKVLLVKVANMTLSGGVQNVIVNGIAEVLDVLNVSLEASAQQAGYSMEFSAAKSTVNPKNGVLVTVAAVPLVSGTNTWAAGTSAQISGTTIDILVYGH